jgi:hypothetical protein
MSMKFSTTVRDNWLTNFASTVGASPKLRMLTGSAPASCAASQTGTQLIEMTLPSTWMASPSGGSASKTGTWTGTTSAAGVASYYRLLTGGGTCHHQGLITQAFKLTTNGSTAAGSNVLNFASTTGVAGGMSVAGTGIPTGATVLSVGSSTVTISAASTSGVAGSTAVYFGDTTGELWMNNTTLGSSQSVTVDDWTMTAPGA